MATTQKRPFNRHSYNTATHSKLRMKWRNMLTRCYDPRDRDYHRYGGRGIQVCQEWRESWDAFAEWALANGHQDGLQIDREYNEGDYCPENCRFVTPQQNSRNMSTNVLVTIGGNTQCLAAWAEDLGLKYHTLYARYRKGTWPSRRVA